MDNSTTSQTVENENKTESSSMPKIDKELLMSKSKVAYSKLKKAVKEGNSKGIVIKDSKGKVIIRIPFTLVIVGVLFLNYLIPVLLILILLTNCTIEIEKDII